MQIDAFEISFKKVLGLSVKSCMNVDICRDQSSSETLGISNGTARKERMKKKKSATLLSISEAACVWGHRQFCKAPNWLPTCGLHNYNPGNKKGIGMKCAHMQGC